MANNKQKVAEKQIKSVTYLGIVINVVLTVVKIVIGLLSGSLALLADGLHSLSDITTDAVVLLGFHLSSKEPDQSHPYGHGRAETFSAGLVALILIGAGGTMIYYAAIALARNEITSPRLGVLIAAIFSIAAKEWLYRVTQKAAIQSHSPALYANAWHHRSDAISSIAVVIGFISLELGFGHGDQIAAVAVGLMIIFVGVHIMGDCLRELTESAIDTETIEHIKQIINSDSSVRQWHKLRTRMVGREVFLDLHILVNPELNIAAAHEISESLENTLDQEISHPVNITIHIEPDIPELRK
jgi:cation diffusion facilitator family transporter